MLHNIRWGGISPNDYSITWEVITQYMYGPLLPTDKNGLYCGLPASTVIIRRNWQDILAGSPIKQQHGLLLLEAAVVLVAS